MKRQVITIGSKDLGIFKKMLDNALKEGFEILQIYKFKNQFKGDLIK